MKAVLCKNCEYFVSDWKVCRKKHSQSYGSLNCSAYKERKGLTESKKYDNFGTDKQKNRLDLLPFRALEEVGKVLTYGANKYGANTWQGIEFERYTGAGLRHEFKHNIGVELYDKESGILHLAHAVTNQLFRLEKMLNKIDKEGASDN
jgi:hypothetical protein